MVPGSLLVELGQKFLALRHLRCIGVIICRERAAIIRQMVRERGRLQIRRILLNYTIALILFHGFGSNLVFISSRSLGLGLGLLISVNLFRWSGSKCFSLRN